MISVGNFKVKISSTTDILVGFRRGLVLIRDISSLKKIFKENVFYKPSDVPHFVAQESPLLLDPVNPVNNLLKKKEQQLRIFAKCAAHTLQLLDDVCKGKSGVHVFAPQPKPEEVLPFKASDWLVGSEEAILQHCTVQPYVTIRNSIQMRPFDKCLELVALALCGIMKTVNEKQEVSPQKLVETSISVFEGKKKSWSPSKESHETKHATCYLPVEVGNQNKYVRCSFDCITNPNAPPQSDDVSDYWPRSN
eukprot:TRINITY_DN22444_c0_g1_i1.p1 TRINITY_DN22444_c0_g1~~TRINITY_DN22444_c0_g1_i1.p1  ORF type:complete len:250 (+),score=45.38 TRINITY_DN22444_c0_g1_i1:664-1413(+)